MATLTRPREYQLEADDADTLLQTVPSPFPREQLSDTPPPSTIPNITLTRNNSEPLLAHGASSLTTTHAETTASESVVQTDLMPSIASVHKSCIMALNNLLYIPNNWHSIIPDRRHSMPANPSSQVAEQDSSPLHTLISNLRHRDNGEMLEFNSDANETELIHELKTRVGGISYQLSPPDAQLALALVQLLSNIHRLSILQSDLAPISGGTVRAGPSRQSLDTDLYSVLKRQLSDFQQERLAVQSGTTPSGASPAMVVQTALIWSKVDEELEAVVAMCRERTEHLPPQYDIHDSADDLPEYELGSTYQHAIEESKSLPTVAASMTNEKMRLDLEAVTMAIDRLYQVAPQLHNQRVELKSSKIAEMERARSSSSTPLLNKGKGKEKLDFAELDNMLGLLSKASDRKLKDQTVILEGGMEPYLQKAQLRDQAKREAFVDRLAAHSGAGRLHSQDAVLQPPRTRNPDAMLTLPEFIREPMPVSLQSESAIPELNKTVRQKRSKTLLNKESGRNRSVSAPSFPWRLKHTRSRSSNLIPGIKSPSSTPVHNVANAEFEFHYVAENHDHLQHVLVFVTVKGLSPEHTVEAEVSPFTKGDAEGDCLAIHTSGHVSKVLHLPARIAAGPKPVVAQPGYYEVRLGTLHPRTHSPPPPTPLMDATQLSSLSPTSFICASCSLPLVKASDVKNYRDLPSEHWEELVDAWMCHTDQKLHDVVSKHSRGFWPEPGQALVGGSYLLFEESNMVQKNVCGVKDNKRADEWQLTRCICGATIGRSQALHHNAEHNGTVYRLLKFAIRPVNPKAEPIKTPISAYVVEDMIEFVQAHATYRFIISDEEEEQPRLLIWLFKPSIHLTYSAPTSYAIPKTGNIHAAKVLFKILKPSSSEPLDLKSILDKYPGFPQAEYLFYPLSACRRLASQLKESNAAYPESMRMMTGLDVGWLKRA